MRQRLGIADVLVKDPQVIIMDEPTLGIDPEGMRELLSLIRALSSRDKRTILISSHQLHQIQQICDRVGIFVQGKLVACGPIAELGRQTQSEGSCVLELEASPDDKGLEELLRGLDGVREVYREGSGWMLHSATDLRPLVSRKLLEAGYVPQRIHQRGGDLDEIYHKYFEKAGDDHDHSNVKKRAKRAGA